MITRAEIESLLPYWQELLKLRDWNVKLLFKRSWDPALNDAVGRCGYEINRKSATITLMDSEDCAVQDEDLEETLVHELLHLHTASFDNNSLGQLNKARRIGMEQMVDLVGIALVQLRRRAERDRLRGLYEGLGSGSLILRDLITKLEGKK